MLIKMQETGGDEDTTISDVLSGDRRGESV